MNKYVPVVFAADDGYAMPTAVAITSLLINKKPKTYYKIYIITPSLSEENIKKLKSLETTDKCSIEIIFAADKLSNIEATLPKVTSTDYYHLMLDNLIPNENKVIALDGDLLVLEDLTELYNTDLENNYLAGCYFRPHDIYNRKYVQEVLGLNIGKRINIGVMVMDLNLIRKDNLQPKLLSKIGKFKVMSEDIINFICKDKIKYIPVKYNYNLHYYKYHYLLKGDPLYSMQEYKEAQKRPVIFHFTLEKPWKVKTKNYKKWLQYFKKSPYKNEKITYNEKAILETSIKNKLFSLTIKTNPSRPYVVAKIFGIKFKIKATKD